MPRTRSLAWSELKIGLLTIAAVILAAVTIFLVTGGRGFFWQRYTLKTRFADVAGLKPGSPVRLAGVEVGSVNSVDLVGTSDQVDVVFQVNKEYRGRITTSSTAKLGSVSLLGEGAVDITPSNTGTPIPDDGYVPTGKGPALISDVTENANRGITEIAGLVHDLRQGRGTAGKLVTDDRLYTQLQQFVTTAGDLARSIREGRGTLGRLVNDRKSADALEASLKNIEAMTAQINSGQGSLGKLLKDTAFVDSLNGATNNLRDLTGRLNRGEGTAGKFVTDPSLFNRLNSVADRFDQLVTKLNDGQGTAGQLLKDKQLYENMNGAVGDLRALFADIRKDPKRYLNVKVSLF
jgi:phospholipid/cholesterol/gamma-HCH transport system substrate-binding protein